MSAAVSDPSRTLAPVTEPFAVLGRVTDPACRCRVSTLPLDRPSTAATRGPLRATTSASTANDEGQRRSSKAHVTLIHAIVASN